MNVVRTFERRLNDAFGAMPQGFNAPISFRKLAKRATREMEAETFVVDGVNTAPALYTILVASTDDAAMRALYPQITSELSDFVEAEGKRRGYTFVGTPLARFMVDPSLRSGHFAVFAENIDKRTLNRLRMEEDAFLSGASAVGGAASSAASPQPVEIAHGKSHRQAVRGVQTLPPITPVEDAVTEKSETPVSDVPVVDGADMAESAASAVPPTAAADDQSNEPVSAVSAAPSPAIPPVSNPLHEIPVPDPVAIPVAGTPLSDDSVGLGVIPTDFVDSQYVEALAPSPTPIDSPAPTPQPKPKPKRGRHASSVVPDETPATDASCLLIDHQSGRTYTAQAPGAIIGRERTAGGIVLRDPNVSRRHAQLSYDGRSWVIQDLHSTNGTLVNDEDISECRLRDGDLITVGLMNLEFRES